MNRKVTEAEFVEGQMGSSTVVDRLHVPVGIRRIRAQPGAPTVCSDLAREPLVNSFSCEEGFGHPVLLRRWVVFDVRGIEDVVEPVHGIFEFLVLHEQSADRSAGHAGGA